MSFQFIREKDKLVQERQLLQKELEGAVLQVRTQYEQQLEIERSVWTTIITILYSIDKNYQFLHRLKSSELQSHIDSLKKQVRYIPYELHVYYCSGVS